MFGGGAPDIHLEAAAAPHAARGLASGALARRGSVAAWAVPRQIAENARDVMPLLRSYTRHESAAEVEVRTGAELGIVGHVKSGHGVHPHALYTTPHRAASIQWREQHGLRPLRHIMVRSSPSSPNSSRAHAAHFRSAAPPPRPRASA